MLYATTIMRMKYKSQLRDKKGNVLAEFGDLDEVGDDSDDIESSMCHAAEQVTLAEQSKYDDLLSDFFD